MFINLQIKSINYFSKLEIFLNHSKLSLNINFLRSSSLASSSSERFSSLSSRPVGWYLKGKFQIVDMVDLTFGFLRDEDDVEDFSIENEGEMCVIGRVS